MTNTKKAPRVLGKTAMGGVAYTRGFTLQPVRRFDRSLSMEANLAAKPASWKVLREVGFDDSEELFSGTREACEAFVARQ